MKIGILSDIHANNYALEAVLNYLILNKVNKIFILGDFVGYYYGVKEMFNLLESWDCESIGGNHETIIKDIKLNRISQNEVVKKYGSGHMVALETMTKMQTVFLFNLPPSLLIEINKKKIFLCHANPWLSSEYIYSNSDISLLKKFGEYDYDYIFFGHSHYPFSFKINNTVCINPGSVGQPRDKYSLSSLVIFDTVNDTFSFHKIPYDKTKLFDDIQNYDPNNNYLRTVLER
ncbi:MAG: YfcE family phosphodiesterase [Ignavibacteriales bacterium]|nr:YfcE family phosphodiesterase [Ignavibacteriales bacterium]